MRKEPAVERPKDMPRTKQGPACPTHDPRCEPIRDRAPGNRGGGNRGGGRNGRHRAKEGLSPGMPRPEPAWIRSLATLPRHRRFLSGRPPNSIAQAAEQLSVTPSAVSQQIKALEERIGTTLVARNGRNIRLTEAGERYFELISDKIEGVMRATELDAARDRWQIW